jgi:hypothetical protein
MQLKKERQIKSMAVKILIELDPDEVGFPPVSVESLNALPLGKGLFKIENAPFFASEISFNDIVRANPTERENQYEFEEVVQASSFTSLSIVILDSIMDSFLMDLLRGLGCVIEYGEFGVYRILAVAVPASTDYQALRKQLQTLEDRESLSFAELAISKNHND